MESVVGGQGYKGREPCWEIAEVINHWIRAMWGMKWVQEMLIDRGRKKGLESLRLKTMYWETVKSKGDCGWGEKQVSNQVKISGFWTRYNWNWIPVFPLLDIWPRENYLKSLCLSLIICKITFISVFSVKRRHSNTFKALMAILDTW